jgi:mRNA turnover protein 4
MPISKRDRVVHTSKVKKHVKSEKNDQIESVREAVAENRYTYAVEVSNERNNILKQIRDEIKPGKLFYSKNKLIQIAIGVSAESECAEGVHKLSAYMTGHCGLISTNMGQVELANMLANHESPEFARAGAVATGTVALEEGFEALSRFPHSMETQLRKLGLPTTLYDGKVKLLTNYTVCTEGEEINSNQAQLLKLMDIQMASFKVTLRAVYDKEKSQVVSI